MNGLGLASVLAALSLASAASALTIKPIFDASINEAPDAKFIKAAIDSAIGVIDGLYGNPVTISTTFTFDAAGPGDILQTEMSFYGFSNADYVKALKADSAANPANKVLITALANLGKGNDADGKKDMALTGAEAAMLGLGKADKSNATININSKQLFSLIRPVYEKAYDLIGSLEHELDEVLGGGGAGSTLNGIAGPCVGDPNNFFCNRVGDLDPYRYSKAATPSFTTAKTAKSYFSVDGGATSIAPFNQDPSGDLGDFSLPSKGPGQLIQNALTLPGQDEDYTAKSPEFAMMQSIGWDAAAPMPEPANWALMLAGVGAIGGWLRRRRWAILDGRTLTP
jgi:hypothetical protein